MNKFEELALPYINDIYRMAFHLGGDKDDAEDMVQEVFLKARKSFHTLRNHEKCKSWLCSILYRHFIDMCRKKKRYVELVEDVPSPEKEENYEWPENISPGDITDALSKLDPKYRAPLVGYFMADQSYKEIATALDIPIGTVMSRIHRAKNMMRKRLSRIPGAPQLRVVRGGTDGL